MYLASLRRFPKKLASPIPHSPTALAHGHPLNLGMAAKEPQGLSPLAELFAPERFHYDVPGRTFLEVLRAALDVLELGTEDKELIYDLLVSREKRMTTALGDGLAIPHLRVPVVVDVRRPALSISLHANRLTWEPSTASRCIRYFYCSVSRQATPGTASAVDISAPPTRVRQAAARAGKTGNDP